MLRSDNNNTKLTQILAILHTTELKESILTMKLTIDQEYNRMISETDCKIICNRVTEDVKYRSYTYKSLKEIQGKIKVFKKPMVSFGPKTLKLSCSYFGPNNYY